MKIMDNTDKQITLIAKQIVEREFGACKDCGGKGFLKIESKCRWFVGDCTGMGCDIDFDCEGKRPCPTCADLRKLAGELCTHSDKEFKRVRHGVIVDYWVYHCNDCKTDIELIDDKPKELKWDIQTLRKLLTRMGEWEGFVDYAAFEYLIWKQCKTCNSSHSPSVSVYPIADILTSDELMAQAVHEYEKGVLNG